MGIVTIGGIPVYDALITDASTGMMKISLVDDPAVMSNFVAFDATAKRMMYSVQDEEKRLVRGVVMRADFPIYRYSPDMGEYYIIYKADQIRVMAEKYLAEARQNNINTMHQADSDVEGVQMVQYFIKGGGVSVEGFDDCADGSLFAEFHIVNDAVWEAVKAGTYKGFSLEGFFDLAPEQDLQKTQSIIETLDGMFNRIFKHTNSNNMSKVSRLKAALAKAFAEFGSITTDNGVLTWDGDDDIKVGDAVSIEDADGNTSPAADGEYKTDDNKVIVVVDGKVDEIKDAEVEEAPTDETPETPAAEVPEQAVEETPEAPVEETPAPSGDEDKDAIIKALEDKVKELEDENAALKAQIAEMQKMSAAKPAHDEFENGAQVGKTGNRHLDYIARIASAK